MSNPTDTHDTTAAAELERLEAEVRATLSPEHLDLAWQWMLATVAVEYNEGCGYVWKVVAEIGRHLPGMQLAIRALGRHIIEEPSKAAAGHCCTDGYDWEADAPTPVQP